MTRKDKFKQWVKDHQEHIAVVGIFAAATTGFVFLIKAENKAAQQRAIEYNAWADGMNDWLNEEREKGHVVYPLDDGRYLTVDIEADQSTVVK